jgi:hypothetical protein
MTTDVDDPSEGDGDGDGDDEESEQPIANIRTADTAARRNETM